MTNLCRHVARQRPIQWVVLQWCFQGKMQRVDVDFRHNVVLVELPLIPRVSQVTLLRQLPPRIPNDVRVCWPMQRRKLRFADRPSMPIVGEWSCRLHWDRRWLPVMFPTIHHSHQGWLRLERPRAIWRMLEQVWGHRCQSSQSSLIR